MFTALWHWIEIHTGTVNESGPYYGFWSGFGSDLGEVTIIGAMVGFYRKANCHSKGCWRIGTHEYAKDGVNHKLCRHCHPVLKGQRHNRAEFHAHHDAKEPD